MYHERYIYLIYIYISSDIYIYISDHSYKQVSFYYFEIHLWQFLAYLATYEETLVLSGPKNTLLLKLVKPPLLFKYAAVVLWLQNFRRQ